jgi:hypothetical protein
MLVGQGYQIVHNTRHAPIEFGKDVIAIAPDGAVCAFQLKGNPGTRLTLTQFREIQFQLNELVSLAINIPGIAEGIQHRAFLVTNGEIDEETHTAIERFNQGFVNLGQPERKLQIIARGTLLSWARELGEALWPSELSDLNALLELMIFDGKENLPLAKIHSLLVRNLRLRPEDKSFGSLASFRRHVTSSALILSLSIRAFQQEKNHYAIMGAWLFYSVYTLASCEKWGHSPDEVAANLQISNDAIFLSLQNLANETLERKFLIEGDALVDAAFFRQRYTLLVALISLYWFWAKHLDWLTLEAETAIEKFLPRNHQLHSLWGEAAVPQFLIHLWYICETSSSNEYGYYLASLTTALIELNSTPNPSTNLASPYYAFDDILRHQLAGTLFDAADDIIREDSFAGSTYYALPLLHLLVRTNLKRECKRIWPDFSKMASREFCPSPRWAYYMWRTDFGENILHQHKSTKEWDELVTEACDCSASEIPEHLKQQPFLFMLFVILCPHRGTPSAIRKLGRQFCTTWFIPAPIE